MTEGYNPSNEEVKNEGDLLDNKQPPVQDTQLITGSGETEEDKKKKQAEYEQQILNENV